MTESAVLAELRLIRQDLKYIKKHMIDEDMILTVEEKHLLDEGRRELRKGKTRTLDDVLSDRSAL
jgi:hypothetical protein